MSPVKFRPVAPIRAEAVAAKLASIRNLELPALWEQIKERPRIHELLWFLQWLSMQEGGLAKWSQHFLAKNFGRIGTPTMRKLGVPASGKYSLDDTRQILCEVPSRAGEFGNYYWRDQLRKPIGYSTLLDEVSAERRAELESKLNAVSYSELLSACQNAAQIDLPHHLQSMCTEAAQDFSGRWYFRDLFDALFAEMDDYTRAVKNGIAQTEVVEKVYDALDYCLSIRKMVHVTGQARYGKSESIKSWCVAQPGVARLVVVPPSNSEGDLYVAVADALGIDADTARNLSDLRARIEHVLKHSKLMLVLDEGHYLWPTKFSKNTAPARLNWVRSILDKRTPVAICFTPQSFKQARNAFSQTTGYTAEQFAGRVMRTVMLPEALSKKDLMAVANYHFPHIDADFLQVIVAAARMSEGYLQTMEAIASLAMHQAKKGNRSTPNVEDLQSAINEIVPTPVQAPATGDVSPAEPTRARRTKAPAGKVISFPPAELPAVASRGTAINLAADRSAQCEQVEA